MTTIPGVGPQLARAAAGTDPRGWLVFESLPDDLQKAEDSTAANDHDRGGFPFARPATETERILLAHLGFELPEELLVTNVSYPSSGVRRRQFPQLETQEVTP